jgi:hypothetical protein
MTDNKRSIRGVKIGHRFFKPQLTAKICPKLLNKPQLTAKICPKLLNKPQLTAKICPKLLKHQLFKLFGERNTSQT